MPGLRQGKRRTGEPDPGLLAQYGIILPQGIGIVAKRLPGIIVNRKNDLPGVFRELVERLRAHLIELNRQLTELEELINAWHRHSEDSRKLAQVPGCRWPGIAGRDSYKPRP